MTDCIARHLSRWTTCPCDPCREQRRRVRKHYQAGVLPRINPSTALERINTWTAAGFQPTWIASATDLAPRYIQGIAREQREGHPTRIGQGRAERIMAANIWSATVGRGPATGARRRLQELAAAGWTVEQMETDYGLSKVTLASLQRGEVQAVHATIHHSVAAMHADLAHTDGPSDLARKRAWKLGWRRAGLLWDDLDNDPEPTTSPREKAATSAERIRDYDWLTANGTPIHDALNRTGFGNPEHLRRARQREAQKAA